MAEFTVNPERRDPYKNFKFRVRWEGEVVAGVMRAGPLRRTTDVVEHREGGDPSAFGLSPGATRFEPVVLERGVTHDTAFEEWANKVWSASRGDGVSLQDFRREIDIDLLNEAGQVVLSYRVHRAWVMEYQALPDLDAGANTVAIERLVLAHEGWERDRSITEPREPSFDD